MNCWKKQGVEYLTHPHNNQHDENCDLRLELQHNTFLAHKATIMD